ncbi:hypothetical protein D3C73_1517850 [compost metagenome]
MIFSCEYWSNTNADGNNRNNQQFKTLEQALPAGVIAVFIRSFNLAVVGVPELLFLL